MQNKSFAALLMATVLATVVAGASSTGETAPEQPKIVTPVVIQEEIPRPIALLEEEKGPVRQVVVRGEPEGTMIITQGEKLIWEATFDERGETVCLLSPDTYTATATNGQRVVFTLTDNASISAQSQSDPEILYLTTS